MIRLTPLIGLTVLLAGCGKDGLPTPSLLPEAEIEAARATELDSLAAAGARVSVSGTVLEQDRNELILDEGTGLILIELPEEPPLLTHQHLMAAGRLSSENGALRLRATEWLYDSTAVPVHSD